MPALLFWHSNTFETQMFHLPHVASPTASRLGPAGILQTQLQRRSTRGRRHSQRPEEVESKPYYDRMNLVIAVKGAAESFHDAWLGGLIEAVIPFLRTCSFPAYGSYLGSRRQNACRMRS